MRATDIAAGAPTWVYGLLVALLILGIRRLRTREVPVVVALIPPLAFLVWSMAGVHAFAAVVGIAAAVSAWIFGAVVGAASTLLFAEPRGQRLPNGRVRQPGSSLPLFLYLTVFVARFACGAWAAIDPTHAHLAIGIGIAVGAAMTARLVVGIVRWQSAATENVMRR